MTDKEKALNIFLEDNSIYYDTPNFELFLDAYKAGYQAAITEVGKLMVQKEPDETIQRYREFDEMFDD